MAMGSPSISNLRLGTPNELERCEPGIWGAGMKERSGLISFSLRSLVLFKSNISVGVIAFGVVVVSIVSYHGIDSLLLPPNRAIEHLSGDATNYLKLGIDLSSGHLQEENRWILNLWPPGMAVLNAGFVLISFPPILGLALLQALLWGLVVQLVWIRCYDRIGLLGAIGATSFLLTIPVVREWAWGEGVAHSDGIAAASLFLGTLLYQSYLDRESESNKVLSPFWTSVVSSFLLVSSIFLRWTYLVPVLLLVTFGFLKAARSFLIGLRLSPSAPRRGRKIPIIPLLRHRGRSIQTLNELNKPVTFSGTRSSVLRRWSRSALVMCALALPYTILAGTIIHPGNYRWSVGSDYYSAFAWFNDSDLIAMDAEWYLPTEVNWGCRYYPADCEMGNSLALSATYQTRDFTEVRMFSQDVLLSDPLPLIFGKGKVYGSRLLMLGSRDGAGLDLVVSWAAFTLLGWSLVRSKTRFRFSWFVMYVTFAFIAWSGVLLISHIELRYLIPVITLVPLIAIAGVSPYRRQV